VVLDDAVVDQGDAGVFFGRREVRVGVVVAGAPWVAQRVWAMPVKPCRCRFLDLLFEVGHARGAARARQAAIDVQGNAAGIVATVFEALQAFDQDRGDVALGYCSDDTAHDDLSNKS
jgi:hypothetical protein